MEIVPNQYSDFVTVIRSIGALEAVFYREVSGSDFRAWAFLHGGSVVVRSPSTTPAAKPGSFDDDFPGAVALDNLIAANV